MNLPQGWSLTTFDTILNYEQPTAYIVKSTEYNDAYQTAVLTAGKSFIIGYTNEKGGIYSENLPVIIFDDFTTAIQYVTFPFKVKSSAMKILQPISKQFDKKYIYYYMQTIKHNITTHKRYWISDYSKRKIPFPPLPEQHRIVAKIDSLFSELDNGVTLLKTIKTQLAIYRQAVLKWAFEGKLTEEWRKLNRVMTWKNVTIERFLVKTDKAMSTGPFGTMLKKHEHQTTGVPVLGIENIGNGVFIHGNKIFVTPDKAEYLKSFVLHTNDVIISRSGTVGELCLVPQQLDGSLMSTNLIRVTLDENVIIPKFFVFLFQSKGIIIDQVKELCKGSTRAFLNQTILKKISFPLLTIDEQQQIINAIESRLSVCDKLEQTIDQTLALSVSLRQSILKKAFEGWLVPQDPNDEPAEKLLERIKAEKAAVLAKLGCKKGRQKQTRKRGRI